METILAAIEERKRAFAALPLFDFLRDDSLDPEERLAFYPCMAPWIMSFADLNKYFLRQEPAADEYQRKVNLYSREDDDHWQLYLEDFRKLGCDRLFEGGAGWLQFLWGDETRANRMLPYRLSHLITEASGVQRLALVEAMEEAANAFFPLTLRLAEQFEARTGVELRYLGHFHFNLEAEHTGAGDHEALGRIRLDPTTSLQTVRMVNEVFDLFEDWAAEVLGFALSRLRRRPALRAAA